MFGSAKTFDKEAGRAALARRRAMTLGDHWRKILKNGAIGFGLWSVIAMLNYDPGPRSFGSHFVLVGLGSILCFFPASLFTVVAIIAFRDFLNFRKRRSPATA